MLAIIQARVNSKRFPEKVLKKINDITVLERVIGQVNEVFDKKNIIVATSKNKRDRAICNICKKNKIKYFRGNLSNVSKRYYDLLKKNKTNSFLRVCADSPFLDPILIKRCVEIFKKKKPDFLTNVLPRSFPKGQSIEIFKSKFFVENFKKIKKKYDLEHVTTFFYFNKKKFNFINIKNDKNLSKISMCIDYKNDLNVANKALLNLKPQLKIKNWKKYIKFFK
jgi:spore coat polysaccharide biosynthesis protein SpsF